MGQRHFVTRVKLSPASKKNLDNIVYAHQQLFSKVQEFIGLAQSGAARTTLLPLIDVILKSSIAHFCVEENLLCELMHPTFASLAEAHCQIVLELVRFQDSVTSERDITTSEYHHVLDDLIIHDTVRHLDCLAGPIHSDGQRVIANYAD